MRAVGLTLLVALAGCASLLDLDDAPSGPGADDDSDDDGVVHDDASTGSSSGAQGGSSGHASSSGGGGSSSSSSSSGAGGPLQVCAPGVESPCPLDPCGTGHWTCNDQGTGFGACTGTSTSCTGTVTWSERFGNTDPSAANEKVVAAAGAAGYTYLIGTLDHDVDFDGMPVTAAGHTAYLTKLAFDGSPVWTKSFSAATSMAVVGVAADPAGNVVVVGNSKGQTSDLGDQVQTGTCSFVVSFAADGSRNFSRPYCDPFAPIFTQIAVAADGAITVAGQALFASDLGGGDDYVTYGGSDVAVLSLDSAGAFRWNRVVGGDDNDSPAGLAVDALSGDVLVAVGGGQGPIAFGEASDAGTSTTTYQVAFGRLSRLTGEPGWTTRVDGVNAPFSRGIVPAFGGGFAWLYSGSSTTAIFPNGDQLTGLGYVARFDGDGHVSWVKNHGAGNPLMRGATIDLAGNVVVVGKRRPGVAVDLGDGPVTWSGGEVPWSEDSRGYVTFFAKYSPTGALRWATTVGDTGYDDSSVDQAATAVVAEPGGALTVFGQFFGTMPLGSPSLVSAGGTDLFVARLAP